MRSFKQKLRKNQVVYIKRCLNFQRGFQKVQQLMLHVSIFFILFLVATSTHPLYFNNKQIKVDVSSARKSTQFQMIISINAPIHTQLTLETESFDPKHKFHKLKVQEGQILIQPKMKDQTILMNQKNGEQNRVAFTHQMNTQNFQFISLLISHEGEKQKLILPSLDMRLNHLHQTSLYKCHNLLVSIELDNSQSSVWLSFFTVDKKQSIWMLGKEWKNSWRHADNEVFYGGAHKEDISSSFIISLVSGKHCKVDLKNLPKNHNNIASRKYYKVKNLLDWAPPLKLEQQYVNEQL